MSVQVTINVNQETANLLTTIKYENGQPINETIRRALATYDFFRSCEKEGKKVLIKDPATGKDMTFHLM